MPKENLLGKEGQGFKIAMQTLDGGRIGIAPRPGIAEARWTRPPLFMSPLALSGPTALSIPARGSGCAFSPAAAVHRNLRVRRARPPARSHRHLAWTWTTLSPPGRKCGWPAWPRWKMPFSSSLLGERRALFQLLGPNGETVEFSQRL